jgi:hypothetical protein
MKKLLLAVMIIGYGLTMTSCASTETCWAYRDVGKHKYNNHKHRPSVAAAKGMKRAKLRY